MNRAERTGNMKQDDEYRVINRIGILSDYTDENGDIWTKEVNLISWGNNHPVVDIRCWCGGKYKDGIEMTEHELNRFYKSVSEWIRTEKEKRKAIQSEKA